MKYELNTVNHCDFGIMEINRLAPRAYAIPYTKRKSAEAVDYMKERFESDIAAVLSGEWEFKYYPKKSKMPAVLDTDRIKFDTVKVPSTWQRTGYEKPVYLNCPYGFDPDALGEKNVKRVPPELPDDFSCGVYRKKIQITDLGKVYIITFLGAVPCMDLYVNGTFVGYGECAHNSYEFDLTPYLCEGENEIVAVLYKWCNASYLEAQDMFRENGIFRDVLLYSYDKTYVFDFEARPQKKGKKYDLPVKAVINGKTEGFTVKVQLTDGKTVVAEAVTDAKKDTDVLFKGLTVDEWNAEVPRLYTLFITLMNGKKEVMTIRAFIGFKWIEIKNQTFFFNGKKVKLKGVNHHDTHETKGYAMSYDDLLLDVTLMKQYNVNCVRTSHYPPDPHFLELCDHFGLYTVDEADIETHGLWHLGSHISDISENLKWAKRYMDRVRRMYYRDRSHTCVTMWSLGNESEGYKCQDKCYKMLKELCPEIPVHYEGVCRTKRQHYDVYSEMYTHPDNLLKIKDRTLDKHHTEVPFYLCEYCHAMGFGPGALEDYFRIFHSDDIFMGGCIWEWADHSVLHDKKDGYKYQYTYGGDHGEKLHDGCFCVDGLFYPDRTPHTGALEMKAVYRPLRATRLSGNTLTILNTNRFRPSSYIEVYWELQENGETTACGSFSTDIAPEKSESFKLDLPKIDPSKNAYLNLTYLDKDFEIASEQLTLNEAPFDLPGLAAGKISITSENDTVTVKYDGGYMEFSEENGELKTYKKDGVNVLSSAPVSHKGFLLNFTRAFNDNDRPIEDELKKHCVDNPRIVLEDLSAEVKGGIASVGEYLTVYGAKEPLFNASVLYIIGANGALDIEVSVCPAENTTEKINNLPRLGLTFEADKKFSQLTYFGRGPAENLSDFNAQAPIGLYESDVAFEHEAYVRPQDNMNHSDVSYLTLADSKGNSILIYSDKRFTFNVHNYTQELLTKANHREDVYDQKTTFVTLDGFTRGTGTGSCGPSTLPEYSIDCTKELSFGFTIVPKKGE